MKLNSKKHKHVWLNNRFGGFGRPPISVCKKCKMIKLITTLEDYKNLSYGK